MIPSGKLQFAPDGISKNSNKHGKYPKNRVAFKKLNHSWKASGLKR
jgi:hypothetical protein